jgi:hypothetical protein
MPIKSLEQRKRQRVLLFVALAIILAGSLILYFGFLKPEIKPPGTIAPEVKPKADGEKRATLITERRLEKIKLDIEFLTKELLPALKIHGDLPIKKGETGRDNPYLPYQGYISE